MSKSNIEYFINKENGTVVAKFKNDRMPADCYDECDIWADLVTNAFLKINKKLGYIFSNSFREEFYDEAYRRARNLGNRIGKAVCASGDEFDVEIGKKVAREKLLEKYYKFELYMMEDLREHMVNYHEVIMHDIKNRISLDFYKTTKYAYNHVKAIKNHNAK